MKTIVTTSPHLPSLHDYTAYLAQIWENKWLTNNGPIHEQFKLQLVEKLHTPYLTLFTNGHSALETTLKALDLEGEIITTPFTFVSTANAIRQANCTPVFCDVNMADGTIDVSQIERFITERTTAILAVHVYGHLCDVEQIEQIAQKYKLKVIYDAAHAFNVCYKGKSVASYGDAVMFSFHATKVFHTIEGGAVAVKDLEVYRKIEAMKNFGLKGDDQAHYLSGNGKMSELQAAMGLCNLPTLEAQIEHRKTLSNSYKEKLAECPLITFLTPQLQATENYAYMPIRVDGTWRDSLYNALLGANISARKYFYPLIHEMPAYEKFQFAEVPNAKTLANEILALPLHANLTEEDVHYICEAIKKWQHSLQVNVCN